MYDFLSESLPTRKRGPISFTFALTPDSFFTGNRVTLRNLRFLEADFGRDGGDPYERMTSLGKDRPPEIGRVFPLRVHRSQIF